MKTAFTLALLATTASACIAGTPPSMAAQPAGTGICCDKTAVTSPADDCCQTKLAATPFSKDSIYQLDGRFTDDSGRSFSLGSLRGRPVVLDMFFASCGYACPLAVTDMLSVQQRLPSELRNRIAFVLVSFDIARDTPAALAKYRAQRQLDGDWILLHGDEGSVRELAALLGVQYRKTADGAFTHSNQITVLNGEGEVIHVRKGLQGGLDETVSALTQCSK